MQKIARLTMIAALLGCSSLVLAQGEPKLIATEIDKMLAPGAEIKAVSAQKIAVPLKAAAVDLGDGVKLEMMLVPAGTFTMGTQELKPTKHRSKKQIEQASPAHQVTLTKPFWIGKYEITQEQWKQITGTNFTSSFKGPKNPVDSIDWSDCQPFLDALSAKAPGGKFRLPTEAEWEYACRAGSESEYCCGTNVDAFAWYSGNAKYTSHPVGQKAPNAWGIFDMHGNVLEWCSDFHGPYTADDQTDPLGPATGPGPGERFCYSHALRSGGCVPYDASMPPNGSAADRIGTFGLAAECYGRRNKLIGLRVVRDVE